MVWKMFKVNDKKHQSGINEVVLGFFIVDFEQMSHLFQCFYRL